MGGGLMQLVAVGAQDVFLSSNPQITFFKVVYRRHTNFSREAIEQTINGTVSPNQSVNVTVSRNGDLIHRVYVEAEVNAADITVDNVGYNQIEYAKLEIGGQQIDKLPGHWMETWAELTEPNQNGLVGCYRGIGPLSNEKIDFNDTLPYANAADSLEANACVRGTKLQRMAGAGGVTKGNMGYTDGSKPAAVYKINVPLPFSFCRNAGLALPLIALQYHEVKIELKWSTADIVGTSNLVDSHKVWVDYIYLDTEERRRFAQVSHEYLIEQVQHEEHSGTAGTKTLHFNHPVKELVFTGARSATLADETPLSLADTDGTSGIKSLKLTLNGQDRFAARDVLYFTRTQVWEHHTGFGGVTVRDNIGVYSFALKPEEHQPSGTCNFSRIDTAQLVLGASKSINVYAVNYNILRIQSGMGGLAYSN